MIVKWGEVEITANADNQNSQSPSPSSASSAFKDLILASFTYILLIAGIIKLLPQLQGTAYIVVFTLLTILYCALAWVILRNGLGPAPPRSKKGGCLAALAIIISIILIAGFLSSEVMSSSSNVSANPGSQPNKTTSDGTSTANSVSITDVSCQMTYSTPGYLPYSKEYMTTVTSGPLTTTPGSIFTVNVTFTNNAAVLNHTVETISISPSSFTLISVYPGLPTAEMPVGSSLTETLTIKAPDSSYTGALVINAVALS